jgi:hypothetical protein
LINIPDIDSLIHTLDKWIPIYNNERTNSKGQYLLTPFEIYNGKTIDKTAFKERLILAKAERISFNKQSSCGIC